MGLDPVAVAFARLDRALGRRRAIVGTVNDDHGRRFYNDLRRVHDELHGHFQHDDHGGAVNDDDGRTHHDDHRTGPDGPGLACRTVGSGGVAGCGSFPCCGCGDGPGAVA